MSEAQNAPKPAYSPIPPPIEDQPIYPAPDGGKESWNDRRARQFNEWAREHPQEAHVIIATGQQRLADINEANRQAAAPNQGGGPPPRS
jgi:hypothetical protein